MTLGMSGEGISLPPPPHLIISKEKFVFHSLPFVGYLCKDRCVVFDQNAATRLKHFLGFVYATLKSDIDCTIQWVSKFFLIEFVMELEREEANENVGWFEESRVLVRSGRRTAAKPVFSPLLPLGTLFPLCGVSKREKVFPIPYQCYLSRFPLSPPPLFMRL